MTFVTLKDMVTTIDVSTRKKQKEFSTDLLNRLNNAQAERKQFLDTKIIDTFKDYAKDMQISPSVLNLKYEGGGLGIESLFDAIILRKDKFFKNDIAHFIATANSIIDCSLEVTVYEKSFQKYATSITEEYEKKFGDKAVIFTRYRSSGKS